MTPDEWRKGLENEAASVEDGAWARETQRYLRRPPQHLGLLAVAALVLSVAVSGAATLGTQLPVLAREAARNGTDLSTFLIWNGLGNPQPIETVSYGHDPAFPSLPLLMALLIGAAFAARARLPHWLILLCAAAGTLTVATLTNLVLPDFAGFPLVPLMIALGVAALGILLGLPLQHRRTLA